MKEQIIKTSEGCPYSCPFCFNGKNDFKEYDLPEIKSNKVILHDDAFLSRENVIADISILGNQRVNGKVIYYELTQGINLKDLNQNIANALKENRFINLRFAWDDSYMKKSFYCVYDGIKMLLNAGYKRKDLMCYILSNYYVSLRECLYKSKIMLHKHIRVCNCVYKEKYLDPKIYPKLWTMNEIEYFKQECRMNNQIIILNGFDSEIKTRLTRAITLPSAVLKES